MSYTPIYEKPYPDGWKNKPLKTTPLEAKNLNDYDSAIENIEDYLAKNDIHSVNANPEIEESAPALSSMEIDGVNYKLAGGGGSGGSSIEISTEERETGIIYYGKKVYSKSYNFSAKSIGSKSNIATDIDNKEDIETIVLATAHRPKPNSADLCLSIWWENDTSIWAYAPTGFNSMTRIDLLYTKTTDEENDEILDGSF